MSEDKKVQPDGGCDAALTSIKRYAFDPYGMREDSEGAWVQRTEALAAHPANGAQAGLSDAEIMAIQVQYVPKHGWSTNGVAFARAILAATKKSG